MKQYEVVIIKLVNRAKQALIIEVDEAEVTENIVIKATVTGQEIVSSNYNYLSAYQDFRDKLLHLGYGIKCNGSRINAVQSGMMGSTAKVYLVKQGEKALMKDVVNIFDYAELDEFPNTKQQKDSFESWIKSLRK